MKNILKLRLQLFAEGAPTGEAGADSAGAGETQTAENNSEVAAQDTAENDGQLATDETQSGENLDEEFLKLIKGKYKDSYEKHFKEHIGHRTKGMKAKEEELEAQKPIIDFLKQRYGSEDLSALANAIEEDGLYIQKESMETGKSEAEILEGIRSKRQEREAEKTRNEERAELESMRKENEMRQRLSGWKAEADELKSKYPSLNLSQELKNKAFFDHLHRGLSVEDAYILTHHTEIVEGVMSKTAEDVKKKTLDNIAAGANRPTENGSLSQASAKTDVDVNSLTGKDVLNILKQVENGVKIIL